MVIMLLITVTVTRIVSEHSISVGRKAPIMLQDMLRSVIRARSLPTLCEEAGSCQRTTQICMPSHDHLFYCKPYLAVFDTYLPVTTRHFGVLLHRDQASQLYWGMTPAAASIQSMCVQSLLLYAMCYAILMLFQELSRASQSCDAKLKQTLKVF
jgi:hypothetical protein